MLSRAYLYRAQQRATFTRGRPLTTAAVERAERAVDSIVEEHEPSESPMCPVCVGGDGAYLGTLGVRAHYRCIACGCNFSEVQL